MAWKSALYFRITTICNCLKNATCFYSTVYSIGEVLEADSDFSPEKKFSLCKAVGCPYYFYIRFLTFLSLTHWWGAHLPARVSATAVFHAKTSLCISEFKFKLLMTTLEWWMIIERFYNEQPIYHTSNPLHLLLWDKPVSADCGLPLQWSCWLTLLLLNSGCVLKRSCLSGKQFTLWSRGNFL